jgi:hypothetical protein
VCIEALNYTPLTLTLIHTLYEESTPWEQVMLQEHDLHHFHFGAVSTNLHLILIGMQSTNDHGTAYNPQHVQH